MSAAPDEVSLLESGGHASAFDPAPAPVGPPAGAGDEETKGGYDMTAVVEAKVRAQVEGAVREQVKALLGEQASTMLSPDGRASLIRNAFLVVKAEIMISGFTRHLFASTVAEVLFIVLAILFYFGDPDASTSHFVFIFVLHLLRPWGIIWVLNRLPLLDDFVGAVHQGPLALERAKANAIDSIAAMKRPLVTVALLTAACLFLDVIAVFVRLWSFRHIPTEEISPSILLLLLAMAFAYIDFSAVLWFWSMRYNLPKRIFTSLSTFVGTHTINTSHELLSTTANFLGVNKSRPDGAVPLAGEP